MDTRAAQTPVILRPTGIAIAETTPQVLLTIDGTAGLDARVELTPIGFAEMTDGLAKTASRLDSTTTTTSWESPRAWNPSLTGVC